MLGVKHRVRAISLPKQLQRQGIWRILEDGNSMTGEPPGFEDENLPMLDSWIMNHNYEVSYYTTSIIDET